MNSSSIMGLLHASNMKKIPLSQLVIFASTYVYSAEERYYLLVISHGTAFSLRGRCALSFEEEKAADKMGSPRLGPIV